jgi:hypothetical protein
MIRPSRVTKFATALKTTESITLEFDVSSNEKSAIDQFLIFVFEENYFDVNLIDQRDYCQNPINGKDTVIISTASEMLGYDDRECCEKCCDEKRKAREAEDDDFKKGLIKFSDKVREDQQKHFRKIMDMKGFINRIEVKGNERTYEVKNLKPFTFYKFHIYACTKESTCSEYELHTDKTAHNEEYDHVELGPLSIDLNKVVVEFEEPKLINGAIVSYVMETREIKENSSHLLISECITRKKHQKNGFR